MKNRDEIEPAPAPAPGYPLQLSRDGGKTWEDVGTVGACLDLGDGRIETEMAPSPLVRAWIRINDPASVVKMTMPCSQNDSPP